MPVGRPISGWDICIRPVLTWQSVVLFLDLDYRPISVYGWYTPISRYIACIDIFSSKRTFHFWHIFQSGTTKSVYFRILTRCCLTVCFDTSGISATTMAILIISSDGASHARSCVGKLWDVRWRGGGRDLHHLKTGSWAGSCPWKTLARRREDHQTCISTRLTSFGWKTDVYPLYR